MFEYSWPGNVRELQNIIERAVLLSKDEVNEAEAMLLGKASFKPVPTPSTDAAHPVKESAITDEVSQRSNGNGRLDGQADPAFENISRIIINKVLDAGTDAKRVDIFNKLEGALVQAALERTKGNKQAAADLLGVYRARLYGMIKRHNL
jgi:DNA-binding NtrC family response regulator